MHATAGHAGIDQIADVLRISKRAAEMRATRESWPYTEQAVRGGRKRLYPIASLPEEIRHRYAGAIIAKSGNTPSAQTATEHGTTLIAGPHDKPPVREPTPSGAADERGAREREPQLHDLSRWQIEVGTARANLIDECSRIAGAASVSIRQAERLFVREAKAARLAPAMLEMTRLANARRGTARTVSLARLSAWRALAAHACTPTERIVRLAPGTRGKKWKLTDDVAAALAIYRQPNKPSLAWCAKEVIRRSGVGSFGSLYQRLRREIDRLPAPLFHAGRNTGAALKALLPFRRREFQSLRPNDVWIGDGHAAKLKIAHPESGNPFVPEVTCILDVQSRYVVGWSVALSENCVAVSDALRHAVGTHGVPLVYYSDNGAGQANKTFDAPVTGILTGMGISHEVGIPGNPQGRGVVERFWQTLLIPLARRFATYQGKNADRETVRKTSIEIDRQLRALSDSRSTGVLAMPAKLPTYAQFLTALAEEIEHYNSAHRHRSLPKLDGVNHATPAEYRAHRVIERDIVIPLREELATLFMPAVLRKPARGEVRIWNGIYFSRDLMLVPEGEQVQVCYDIHDASGVWVKRLSGEFLCYAELNGNRSGYFPQPVVEQLREKRAERRVARLESKIAGVLEERGASTLGAGGADLLTRQLQARERLRRPSVRARELSAEEQLFMAQAEAAVSAEPAPVNVLELRTDTQKQAHWIAVDARRAAGETLGEADEQFWHAWQAGSFFRIQRDLDIDFEQQLANGGTA